MKLPAPPSWKTFSPTKRAWVDRLIRLVTAANVWVFRTSGGRLGGTFVGGTKVCLLTTVGRKSGLPRTVALLFLPDGDRLVIVASKGGDYQPPLWYTNLVANPHVEVDLGGGPDPYLATTASDAERDALWPRVVEYYAGYADYQAVADRVIPLVLLTRR